MEQAEKIEQEFVSLMTGHMHGNRPERRGLEDRNDRRKFASPSKLALVRVLHLPATGSSIIVHLAVYTCRLEILNQMGSSLRRQRLL